MGPRYVDVKLFSPTNKAVIRRVRLRAPRGRRFTEVGVAQALLDLAEIVDREMPGNDYRVVQTGKSTYNFVWGGGGDEEDEIEKKEIINESVESEQAQARG